MKENLNRWEREPIVCREHRLRWSELRKLSLVRMLASQTATTVQPSWKSCLPCAKYSTYMELKRKEISLTNWCNLEVEKHRTWQWTWTWRRRMSLGMWFHIWWVDASTLDKTAPFALSLDSQPNSPPQNINNPPNTFLHSPQRKHNKFRNRSQWPN